MPSRIIFAVRGVAAATILAATPLRADPQEAERVSALLKQQTQLFSDAGQRGDGAAMAALLDDRVVFFNEGGDVATKADMASATPTPHPGVTSTITVTDWHCEPHGDVAVASFVDELRSINHGELFHARFRSVETWHKVGARWLMIGSETIALNDDPPAATLAPAVLDQYIGTYRDAAGNTFVMKRDGDRLAPRSTANR